MEQLKKINNYCLYLLIFSATFEYWDPFGVAGTITVARMVTIIYILTSLPFIKGYLKFRFLTPFITPLLFLILSGVFSTIFNDYYVLQISEILNTRFIQLVLLMILIIAHVVIDKKVLRNTLNVYVLSLLVMSLLFMMGVGITYKTGRLFLFGENSNLTGFKSVIAILIIFAGLVGKKASLKKMVFSTLMIIPLLVLLLGSASRGALLSLILGLLLMLALLKVKVIKKLVLIGMGLVLSFFLLDYIQLYDRDFAKRIESTVYKSETGGRTKLWESAFNIIGDNYFFGVGHPGVEPAMLRYGRKAELPHNIFLEIWLSSGILGLLFFLLFLYRITKNLIRRYKETGQVLGLVLLFVIILNLSKSGGAIGIIFAWIFFGLLISSTIYIDNNITKIYTQKNADEKL